MVNRQRRAFIKQGLTGLLLSSAPALYAQVFDSKENPLNYSNSHDVYEGWFSAQGSEPGKHGFATEFLYSQSMEANKPVIGKSGFRGHGGAQHTLKPNCVLLFGRRPSTESIEINLLTAEVTNRFYSQPGYHFFGHGAFSHDGKYLYTSEANLESNKGVIGIRDAKTYEWLGEFSSHGIGPHQLMVMPNGKQLVVANGGILTRPETGRKKLNLDKMSSNLSYINIETGALDSQWFVPEPKASIRHLDVAKDGTVALAMQVQRQASGHKKQVSLAGIHKANREIVLLEQQQVMNQMNDYIGSVAIHEASRTAGFTSPRGDIVGFWHLDTGEFKGFHTMKDVCGITVSNHLDSFIVTNSYGAVHYIDGFSLVENIKLRKLFPNLYWDNHMVHIQS